MEKHCNPGLIYNKQPWTHSFHDIVDIVVNDWCKSGWFVNEIVIGNLLIFVSLRFDGEIDDWFCTWPMVDLNLFLNNLLLHKIPFLITYVYYSFSITTIYIFVGSDVGSIDGLYVGSTLGSIDGSFDASFDAVYIGSDKINIGSTVGSVAGLFDNSDERFVSFVWVYVIRKVSNSIYSPIFVNAKYIWNPDSVLNVSPNKHDCDDVFNDGVDIVVNDWLLAYL